MKVIEKNNIHESKLIELLKTFDKEDWRWFRKFLLSPYFNSREELIPLFEYLRSQYPEFKPNNLKKEKVFKKIFPNQAYNEKQLTYSMSYLLSRAEQFLAQRNLEATPATLQSHLLHELVNRQLDKHYRYQNEKANTYLQKRQAEHIDYYYFQYHLKEIGDLHFINQNQRVKNDQLQNAYDCLNDFYFLKILKHSCEMLTRHKVYGAVPDLSFTNEVVQFLERRENMDALITIFLQIYYTLTLEDAEANFEKLKQLLESNEVCIPNSEKGIIYIYAINYAIYQCSRNNRIQYYTEQCLNFYLRGIKEGFLLNKGYLTPWTFKNVIKMGLTLKRYEFTEDFIQQYHKKLEVEFQEDALHFNLADLYYRKKNYDLAHTHLIQVQFSDIFYTLGAKAILLKLYYETQEEEALLSLLASFSIYLKRQKTLAQNVQQSYLNFTTLLSKFVRRKYKHIPEIIAEINDTQYLSNRSWLLKVCEEELG